MMSIIDDRRAGASTRQLEEATGRDTTAGVAGWFDDPEAQHHLRYHDGVEWTAHVTHFGPTPCSGCG